VKHPFNLEKFFSFLESQSFRLLETQKDQFRVFHQLIQAKSLKQNLVSKNDIKHLVERHFLPSAFLAKGLFHLNREKIIDIGTGAGFPGVVLKILMPEISVTLLDSSYKKVLFLEEACSQLNLNSKIVNVRCEEYKPDSPEYYDVVVSRAVARLKLLWNWCEHLIPATGKFYALKGGDYHQEIEELDKYGLTTEVIAPEKEWLQSSDYLEQKYIVKLER
jgi:16S rRNA (guanine527-N7)-methyltransferase